MRLVYVHTAPVPSSAANAVQVVHMCKAFGDAGLEVVLVSPPPPRDQKESIQSRYGLTRPLDVHQSRLLGMPGGQLLYGAWIGYRFGRRAETIFYTRSVSVAFALAATGRDVVLEAHGPSSELRPRVKARLVWLSSSPRLRRLVVISERLAQHYGEAFPVVAERIIVAHDGAHCDTGVKAKDGVAGSFKVGYVGQLYPGKGMEIIAGLAVRLPGVTFHVVGGNPPELRLWRGRLAAQSNVVFHGYVPHSETPSLIEAMDVVIAPYLRVVQGVGGGGANLAEWMSPLKLFEYMSRAKAIISSDLPVLREVLEDGVDALLCPPEDLAAWGEALVRLRCDPALRDRLGKRARDKLLSSFTWDIRACRIRDSLL